MPLRPERDVIVTLEREHEVAEYIRSHLQTGGPD